MKKLLVALTSSLLLSVLAIGGTTQAQTARIIGGQGATEGEWPWMVSIFPAGGDPANPGYGHFCGGALITPNYVVTAAHCVADLVGFPEEIEVVVGRTRLSSSAGTRSLVRSIVVHPNFDSFLLRNDIALLKLEAPVPQASIDLVMPGDEALWSPGTDATIIGWGQTDPNYPVLPDNLQEAIVPIQSDLTCQENLGLYFDPSAHMCAGILASTPGGDDGVDGCNGDSGSPLMVPDGFGWKLAGLTSWGFGCATHENYGVYTRAASYAAWVYSFPPAPPVLRGYPSLEDFDAPTVGTTLKCLPGIWSGENLTYSYQWFRVGLSVDLPIPGAESSSYVLSVADINQSLYCLVTTSNISGNANSASGIVGPVYQIIPDPEPTVSPLDVTGPLTSKQRVSCKKKQCEIEVNASDDLSQVAGVEGILTYQPKGCSGAAGVSRACVAASKLRILDAARTADNTWKFSFKVKLAGAGKILVRGRDSAGNIQAHATKVKFNAP